MSKARATASPLPAGERSTREARRVRGVGSIESIVTPSPHPSPLRGEGADRVRGGGNASSIQREPDNERSKKDTEEKGYRESQAAIARSRHARSDPQCAAGNRQRDGGRSAA